MPYQKVGPSRLPDFYMPFPVRLSPHLDRAARDTSVAWAHRMGILEEGVWDEDKLGALRPRRCARRAWTRTPRRRTWTSAPQWLAWGTYGDDYYPLVFGHRRDLAAAKLCTERLLACMPLDGRAAVPARRSTPMERALADLWRAHHRPP